MRIDKYLKVARIIKRRTIANEACSQGRVLVNDKVAKPGTEVKVGDIIQIRYGEEIRKYEVLQVAEHAPKDDASGLYRIIE